MHITTVALIWLRLKKQKKNISCVYQFVLYNCSDYLKIFAQLVAGTSIEIVFFIINRSLCIQGVSVIRNHNTSHLSTNPPAMRIYFSSIIIIIRKTKKKLKNILLPPFAPQTNALTTTLPIKIPPEFTTIIPTVRRRQRLHMRSKNALRPATLHVDCKNTY